MRTSWNELERAHLAQALATAGPGAPTLCEGWSTEHLAAHVVLRERKPWAVRGATFERTVAEARDRPTFDTLVTTFAGTPPVWSPARWAGEPMNLVEYYVHLQDVVRAGPADGTLLDPEPAHERALWSHLRPAARLLYRSAPVGVVLEVVGGPRAVARKPRSGTGSVVVTGRPSELVLHAFGRGAVADVTVSGASHDVAALAARFPAPPQRA
ncbi:TIGR03085 family metal-binding protein [Sanguibacter sp. 25GB23B1]|uniref:TIGR03085 family metal-binding protein n=1 Tax=unclassified Sanguibacter TaxID=2645534 RepID=UPI0032AEA90D